MHTYVKLPIHLLHLGSLSTYELLDKVGTQSDLQISISKHPVSLQGTIANLFKVRSGQIYLGEHVFHRFWLALRVDIDVCAGHMKHGDHLVHSFWHLEGTVSELYLNRGRRPDSPRGYECHLAARTHTSPPPPTSHVPDNATVP
jgi:hypothetical protein